MAILNAALVNFDPNDNLDLYESITHQNWALKSFGALLESADLEKYFCRHEKNGKYKNGLNQIVELYIHRQEKELKEIRKKSVDSPERIIMSAWKTWDDIVQGELESQCTILHRIRVALTEINQVLLRFGDDYKTRAQEVKDKLLPLQERAMRKLREDAETVIESEVTFYLGDEALELNG